jgi:hypothetical protein
MTKIDLVFGFIIGIITTFIGSYIFIEVFTQHNFTNGILLIKSGGNMGKLITIGAILNFAIFFLLLKLNKELMARGVVLAMIILTIITFFV